jgi:hypothetical protein
MARRVTNVSADGTDLWMNSHGVLDAAADNVLCSRIAEAARAARPGGDSIDHGLSLMAELRRQGFGLIYLGEPEPPSGVLEGRGESNGGKTPT